MNKAALNRKVYISTLNINSVRFLAVDMINHAKSGHPGICLGAAPMMVELYTNHINATAKDSKWFNRDRFVMAAGHGSALLYSMLFHMGYDISLDDIKKFRKVGSKTPGHPEIGITDGVDSGAGPLGQGIGHGVGMAIAEQFMADKFNKPHFLVSDHYTFVLTCDGDLQEGASYEAMSLAGHWNLNKLIVIYDSNDYQLDGAVSESYSESLKLRCWSQHWNYILVKDGEDRKAISKAISKAKKSSMPTMIEIKTILGVGTSKSNTSATHGAPVGQKERDVAAKYFDYKSSPFVISRDTKMSMNNIIESKVVDFDSWSNMMKSYKKEHSKLYKEFIKVTNGDFAIDISTVIKSEMGETEATRNYSPEIISYLSSKLPTMIGGSADLKKSTKVFGFGGNFPTVGGRNINFGVRELSMSIIANGMALHGGLMPFVSGFLIFSDYARPAIRLSAIQQLPVLYVFTHDSVAAGEDGPTHQPIEHLSSLRAMPNLNVVRPADKRETVLAYNAALKEKTRPTMMVLSRQGLKNVSKATVSEFEKGAYIIKNSKLKNPKLTIIATGSEVNLVLDSVANLKNKDLIRVISMPSMDNFNRQTDVFKKSLIKDKAKTLFVEASECMSGYKYADHIMGIKHFGFSGPGPDVMAECKMTIKNLQQKIKIII